MSGALPQDLPTGLWIGNDERPAASGDTIDVVDPATGKVLASVADAGVADAVAALDAAAAVQAEWAATSPRARSVILRRAWELLTERADDFAALMTAEMGKTLAEARGEVAYGAEFFRWFSEEAVRVYGRTATPPAGNGRILVVKQPVGPVLAVTLELPAGHGHPQDRSGVRGRVHRRRQTRRGHPLTMLLLARVLADAGLPDGVLSVIPTLNSPDVVAALMADPRLRKVSFTGSTQVGKILIEQSAGQVLRTSMELGGNAPFIVFDDADIDAAVEGRSRRRCATAVRHVPPPTGFWCTTRSARSSPRNSPRRWRPSRLARATPRA